MYMLLLLVVLFLFVLFSTGFDTLFFYCKYISDLDLGIYCSGRSGVFFKG